MSQALRGVMSAITIILVASTITFFALRILPGDPVLMMMGEGGASSPAAVERMRQALGMDQPLMLQYLGWLGNTLHLNLGMSILTKLPVADEILRRIPRTLELMGGGILVSLGLGIPLGIVAARRPGTFLGELASVIALVGLSAPTFVKGLILVIVFSLSLGWLPSSGYVPFPDDPLGNLASALLPSLTLGLGFSGVVQRVTRASLIETLGKDYVRSARAKGISEYATIYGHALPNAMIPVVSVVGIRIGTMLGGMVVIEQLFNWPGLSSYLIEACYARDYPAIQSTLLVIFAIFAFISLLMEFVMIALDPRRRDG